MADYCGNFLGALASLCFAVTGADTSGAEVQMKALAAPQGRVILTIDGNIGAANAQARADFDLAMLEAMPGARITTPRPGPTACAGSPACRSRRCWRRPARTATS